MDIVGGVSVSHDADQERERGREIKGKKGEGKLREGISKQKEEEETKMCDAESVMQMPL